MSPKKNLEVELANNPFVEFVKLYKNNPVRFVRQVLNTTPDTWQVEFLNHIAQNNRRISVRSGHGVGKSTAAAWAMLWYLFLRFPVKIVVTAPTSSQLYDALFAEVKRWVKVLPPMLGTSLKSSKTASRSKMPIPRRSSPRGPQEQSSPRPCKVSTPIT